MSELTVYKLRPRTPFHLGERGVGLEATEEIVRADALFSAIVSALRELRGRSAAEEFLLPFLDEGSGPPLLISSCFPFIQEILLLPRPFLRFKLARRTASEIPAKLKDVRYLSQAMFEMLLNGEAVDDEIDSGNFLRGGSIWLTTAERKHLAERGALAQWPFWTKVVAPRVAVDRATCRSEVYGCGRVAFADGCGLYFLAEFKNEEYRSRFELALEALGDAGLGGERSCGNGRFAVEKGDRHLTIGRANSTGVYTTLSCYAPTLGELESGVLKHPASYDLVRRFGWICSPEGSGHRRKEVTMIAEGSVLSGERPPRGRLVDVTPDGFAGHKVYRYGLALSLPVSTKAVT